MTLNVQGCSDQPEAAGAGPWLRREPLVGLARASAHAHKLPRAFVYPDAVPVHGRHDAPVAPEGERSVAGAVGAFASRALAAGRQRLAAVDPDLGVYPIVTSLPST
jgi:hypothetical protein